MPRTVGSLFRQFTSFENLLLAFRHARRGKRRKPAAARFEQDLEPELLRLQAELTAGRFRPGPYRSFYIREYKRRRISAAPFRDRVVHHALLNVLEPVFEPRFCLDSYACRKGKGQHQAVDRFQNWLRGFDYVLRGDIRKFYPSVDHGILKEQLARHIREGRLLDLLASILASGADILESEYCLTWFSGDTLFTPLERRRGLPIGNLTSQFFGNVYLDSLDQMVKQQTGCRAYLRYMDDFAVFGRSRAELLGVRERIRAHLAGLRLILNEPRSRIYWYDEGVEFLGFRVFRDHRLVRKCTTCRYSRRLRDLASMPGDTRVRQRRIRESLTAWFGHTGHADAWRLNREVLHRAGLLADDCGVDSSAAELDFDVLSAISCPDGSETQG